MSGDVSSISDILSPGVVLSIPDTLVAVSSISWSETFILVETFDLATFDLTTFDLTTFDFVTGI